MARPSNHVDQRVSAHAVRAEGQRVPRARNGKVLLRRRLRGSDGTYEISGTVFRVGSEETRLEGFSLTGQDGWYPTRDEAYLGVLVDDLITRGVSEPYRMFTSRAEYRLLLREDNADLRLTPSGRELGVVDDQRWSAFRRKLECIGNEQARLSSILLRPARLTDEDRAILGTDLQKEQHASELLRRPELSFADVTSLSAVGKPSFPADVSIEQAEQVQLQLEVQAKYAGYIERQQREIERHAKQASLRLPTDIDYDEVDGLSNEARQRLQRARPITLGHASRLEGVTPSTLSLLLIHLKKRQIRRSA